LKHYFDVFFSFLIPVFTKLGLLCCSYLLLAYNCTNLIWLTPGPKSVVEDSAVIGRAKLHSKVFLLSYYKPQTVFC